MIDVKLDRLQSQLQTSGLQQKDNPLFQVISQLIKYLRDIQNALGVEINNITNTGAAANLDFLTHSDESIPLPNSRNLLAGTGVTFDDSVVNERTVNVTTGGLGYWTPLTDGDLDETDLIFASGECIAVFVPTP